MKTILNRIATPLVMGFFGVSALSGVALFLHVGDGFFHEMHEWLSILLLIPFALHLWRNWGALLAYVRNGRLLWPAAVAIIAAAAFVVPTLFGSGGGDPAANALRSMTEASLADLAPVLKTTPTELQNLLAEQGYKVSSERDSLRTVGDAAGVSPVDLLAGLFAKR